MTDRAAKDQSAEGVEITLEMVGAGASALRHWDQATDDPHGVAEAVYLAMERARLGLPDPSDE